MTLLNVLTHLDIGLSSSRSVLEDHLGTHFCAKKKERNDELSCRRCDQVFIIRRQNKTEAILPDKASTSSGEMGCLYFVIFEAQGQSKAWNMESFHQSWLNEGMSSGEIS